MPSSVWPSGVALATSRVARLPPAPGRVSITTGWPSFSDRCWPMMRARMSFGPPGAKPISQRTGRVG